MGVFMKVRRIRHVVGVLASLSLVVASCGGSESAGDETNAESVSSEVVAGEPDVATTITEIVVEAEEQPLETDSPDEGDEAVTDPAETTPVEDEIPAPAGELRIAGAGSVATYNPAAASSAQLGSLIPVYDTLTRQSEGLQVVPGLATAWTLAEPNVWEFTVRNDVIFHDGAAFDAQVAVDNISYHASFEGNPNANIWSTLIEARVVDDFTFQVEFERPVPQFPLNMSLVSGMMISPNFLDGTDLTRNPQGSGPWIHADGESQAGVTEVYTLNNSYWNPPDQGVERISITSFPDNNARLNALITGEVDISTLTFDGQVQTGLDAGLGLVAVPNFFPFVLIADRGGELNPALGDERVRQAIALSVDREAYNDAIHAGRSDTSGGIYPSNFSQFHWPEFDDKNSYDPERARELLAEAGYPDGVTITMPVMPAINAPVELIVQMLGASGITVELEQLNNGELAPRLLSKEFGITWLRALLDHPAENLPAIAIRPWDTFQLGDLAEVDELIAEATLAEDPEVARELYARAAGLMLDTGAVIPLGHATQNAMYSSDVTGVVMGLGMQSPYPHGVRVDS